MTPTSQKLAAWFAQGQAGDIPRIRNFQYGSALVNETVQDIGTLFALDPDGNCVGIALLRPEDLRDLAGALQKFADTIEKPK